MHQDLLGYRGVVYPWHCDHMGHMNVMWYVGKFDESLWNLLADVGLTPAYLRERQRGMAAVEQTVRYLHELHAGDVLAIHARIVELRDKALVVEQELRDGGAGRVAATMRLAAVHLDTGRRRAVPFEPAIAQRIRERFTLAPAPPGCHTAGHPQ